MQCVLYFYRVTADHLREVIDVALIQYYFTGKEHHIGKVTPKVPHHVSGLCQVQ